MEFVQEENRIYLMDEDSKIVIADITFPNLREGIVDINHTFVDPSLRGQGVAGQLARAAAEAIRARNLKATASCEYVQNWFGKHPEYADILCK